MFKKLLHKTETSTPETAVMAAKLELTRRLLVTGFVLILACLAGVAYFSKAWFANNKDVGAENASVTSETNTANLFIRLNTDTAKEYYSLVRTNWSSEALSSNALYPISTADCVNWYYINDWTIDLSAESDGITTGQYYASDYALASEMTADGLYTGYASERHRAYYCSKYNLYTDKDLLDVYLDPTNPIVIDCGVDEANQGLRDAIRVALVNSEGLVFVYAPVAESGTGRNYVDATRAKAAADTFYAVTDTNKAEVQSNILVGTEGENSLAPYMGGPVDGDPHNFTAGTSKICTATPEGADVSVYVWLEGMDAQSIINVADNRTIGVNLNFVGVPVEDDGVD